MPHAGEAPGPWVLRQTKANELGELQRATLGVTPALSQPASRQTLCHDYPGPTRSYGSVSTSNRRQGVFSYFQAGPCPPKRNMSWAWTGATGAQVSGKFGELTKAGRSQDSCSSANHQRNPFPTRGTPEEPQRPPCRLGQAKWEPRLPGLVPQAVWPGSPIVLWGSGHLLNTASTGLLPTLPGCHIHRLRLRKRLENCLQQ